ncbi:MAG: hypothetical protein AAFZ58_12395 [Pseudomonadota bacterium]
MGEKLTFRATTSSGVVHDFEFPLHPDTASSAQVGELLTALVDTVDRFVAQGAPVGNGDVLQALAMALAVRTRLLGPDSAAVAALAMELTEQALTTPCRTIRRGRAH